MKKIIQGFFGAVLTIAMATGLTAAEYKGQNLSGQTVTIAGPWLTGYEQNFDKVNAYFEKVTGAKVDYSGSDSFERQIVIDIKAGNYFKLFQKNNFLVFKRETGQESITVAANFSTVEKVLEHDLSQS